MSDVVRVNVSHTESDCGPESAIFKFPILDSTALPNGNYRREADIFALLREHDDLAVPKMYGSESGDDPNYVVIVLEEIRDARTVSPTEGCSVDEATEVLRNIARIHSRFWNDHRVPSIGDIAESVERWGPPANHGWIALAERYGSKAGDALAQFEWVKDNTLAWVEHRAGSPQTLAHGDFQPENVLFTNEPTGKNVLIDWQFGGAGPGICDVAMFIISSLTVEERRTHEDSLLKTYHDVLTADGTFDYSFEEMFFDYRAAAAMTLFKALLKAGWTATPGSRSDIFEISDALFERTLAAAQDLAPVEALKEAMARNRA
jgi:Ser/Thr protein kinase RdoA (MazF antagonist)